MFKVNKCFPVNIAKFLRTPTLKIIYERMLVSRLMKLVLRLNRGFSG